MSSPSLLITFISFSAVFIVIADIFGKEWINNHKISYLITALILSLISETFFFISFKYGKLGIASVVWDVITTIMLIGIGYFIYKENLSLPQIIGIVLIFIALFLINR